MKRENRPHVHPIEGHMGYPEKAQELKEKAIAEAKEAAKRF